MKKKVMSVLMFFAGMVLPALAFAEETAGGASTGTTTGLAIASGFGIAIAAFGGALAQGKASAAALEGIARNPGASNKIMMPMIIAMALIESLVIYALVISFLLMGKI